MVGARDYHTKQSESEREWQTPYDITYVWKLKYDTIQYFCEMKTDSKIEWTNGFCWKGEGL